MKTKVWHVFGLIGCLCLVGCGGNNIANYSEDEQVAIKQTTLQMTPDFSYTINPQTPNLYIDQYGYRCDDKKTVFSSGIDVSEEFQVKNVETDKVVYEGKLRKTTDEDGKLILTGEFTSLKEEGTYVISHEILGESYEFIIAEDIYAELFSRFMGHIKQYMTQEQDSSSYVLANMLFTKELYPQVPIEDTYLREQMETLLLSQDEDGAFHNEIGSISLTATAQASGILANYVYLFNDQDPAFAKECLFASQKAYIYLEKYRDNIDTDAWYFAASQLYRTTGGYKYRNAIKEYDAMIPETKTVSEQNYTILADFVYLSTTYATDYMRCETIMNKYLKIAQTISTNSSREHFYVVENVDTVDKKEMLNSLMILGIVNDLLSGREYEGVQVNYIHYYLGVNENTENLLLNQNIISENDIESLSQLLFIFGSLCK